MSIIFIRILPALAAVLILGYSTPSAAESNTVLQTVTFPTEIIPFSRTETVEIGGHNTSVQILNCPEDFPGESYLAVVETISYRAEMPSGQRMHLRFEFNGGTLDPFILYMPEASAWPGYGSDAYVDTRQVKIYAGGGSFEGEALHAHFSRDASWGIAELTISVMGYFMPMAEADPARRTSTNSSRRSRLRPPPISKASGCVRAVHLGRASPRTSARCPSRCRSSTSLRR